MKKDKKLLIRIIGALVLFLGAMIAFYLTPLSSFRRAADGWHFADYRFYVFGIPFLIAYLIVVRCYFKGGEAPFFGQTFG